MSTKKVVYLAHPLGTGEEREVNRKNAGKWAAWLAKYCDVAPSCSWIALAEALPETKRYRDLGIELDQLMVAKCDELWLVGGRISTGMQIEADAARAAGIPIRDLTDLGWEVPESPLASLSIGRLI